ncbi:ATP-binding protein [Mesorhizobium sp. VK24D]|uniref:histidine kinase n=1 Tax=Mesorhizobium album TaxID=3072314 RepID=A0ABU4Y5A4_9HYPH|nr:ATP-binding protein [Mesorhizobium sp. VK24D]MDX8481508.1 ATP-binding protein [Mesorhizobium sp. VK24D]
MTRRGSLIRRVVVSMLFLTSAVGLIAAAAGSVTLHREINEAMDGAMQESARRLLPIVIDDLFTKDLTAAPRRLAEGVSGEADNRLIFQVRDKDGRLLLHSHDAPATPLTDTLEQGFSENKGWRIYTEPAISKTIFVQVAEAIAQRHEEMYEAGIGFLLPIVALTPVSALLAWAVLARFLRPVGRLRAAISERHGDNLDPIRTHDLPVELASIARSVNKLMRRLGLALEAEKEFTANAAHELRTPIAGALAQADRLLIEASDEATRRRARQIKAALSDLANLSEKLMQLARADSGLAESDTPADLMRIAALVVREFQHLGEGGERAVLSGPASGPMVSIDPDALAIVIRNLVENGLRHGAAGSPVTIAVSDDAALRVANEGPIVAREELGKLARRFLRGSTQADGSGLGLAIVAKIVQQAGGTLVLNSPASGKPDGFEAIVRFRPASQATVAEPFSTTGTERVDPKSTRTSLTGFD